ncbi:glutaredoxin family protein [Bacillus sp. V3B]|uniref:glutaredoxin family protein n=1 Tax=Bacillus sp. V3B TaxID=2804915 RepID=UPI002109F387|nr:glutaredoxin family protein [Bacillus sp. V3B]MCQ6275683.1 glutaredoxin family protein [Bacillus sp. V3B]
MKKTPVITLYTRNGCHLCEQAKDVIDDLRNHIDFDYEECDIALNDDWTEKYGLMIPVVMVDRKEIQYGHIDKITLLGALTYK